MCTSIWDPGHIFVDVLKMSGAVCIFCVNHSSSSLSLSRDGRIKLSGDLKDINFIITLFRMP